MQTGDENMKPFFQKRQICTPREGCDWGNKMVLNPAMLSDPENPQKIHMLFRATGPYARKQQPGKPLPYPIFIGYACSEDAGEHWQFDFDTPALAPALEFEKEKLFVRNVDGERILNYTNGCIEDPRLFYFENELYLTVAGRAFPPGPYWEKDDPVQCMPQWALSSTHGLGDAVTENNSVSVLFKVDLARLAAHDYANAFRMVGPLHNPDRSDDRDVFLFPRRLNIGEKPKIVCLHRPKNPERYDFARHLKTPGIFVAAADQLSDFADDAKVERIVFAEARYPWEADRIGASWPPIELEKGVWLIPYHGKQSAEVGYTQSFMIARENGSLAMQIEARPAERLLYADQAWELDGDFSTPCLFTCSGICLPDGKLLMGYGAADTKIGLVSTDFRTLVDFLRKS